MEILKLKTTDPTGKRGKSKLKDPAGLRGIAKKINKTKIQGEIKSPFSMR